MKNLVFLPNYNVATAERRHSGTRICPSRVSTAGCEASGTGNMKFAMNGALTIGTMDGANIEIFERTGPDRHVRLRNDGGRPSNGIDANACEVLDVLRTHPEILETLDFVASASFDPTGAFAPLRDAILGPDMRRRLRGLARLASRRPDRAESHRKDPAAWGASMIHNIAARARASSSDRTDRDVRPRDLAPRRTLIR
jgi:starch phosphorylase